MLRKFRTLTEYHTVAVEYLAFVMTHVIKLHFILLIYITMNDSIFDSIRFDSIPYDAGVGGGEENLYLNLYLYVHHLISSQSLLCTSI